VSAGRRRDRRVYLAGHPLLFGLMAATRGRPVLRVGRTLVVHGADAYLAALTRVPLDRTAAGTTGGAVDRLAGAGGLFDQGGAEHRRARRDLGEMFGTAGVERLRPVWNSLIEDRLKPLADGAAVDLVPVAAELAGRTAAELLGLDADPIELAAAAQETGATAAKAHLPGRRRSGKAASEAAGRLVALTGSTLRRGLATTTSGRTTRCPSWRTNCSG